MPAAWRRRCRRTRSCWSISRAAATRTSSACRPRWKRGHADGSHRRRVHRRSGRAKQPGLVAYVTAGDPDLARTAEILVACPTQRRGRPRGRHPVLGSAGRRPRDPAGVRARAGERESTLRGALDDDPRDAGRDRRADRALHLRQSRPPHGRGRVRDGGRAMPASTACSCWICRWKKPDPFRQRLVDARDRSDLSARARRPRTRGSAPRRISAAGFSTSSRGWASPARAIRWRPTPSRSSTRIRAHTVLPLAWASASRRPSRSREVAPMGRCGGGRQRAGERDCGARRRAPTWPARAGAYVRWLKGAGV